MTEYDSFVKGSDCLLEATVAGDTEKVAAAIGRVHDRYALAINGTGT